VVPMSESPRLPLRLVAASTLLALIAAVFTYVLLSDSDDDSAPTGTIELTPATDLPTDPDEASFTTFDDEVVALTSLRGTPTVVNFFASYCVPCIKEMPALEEVHQELGGEVAFLGLALQDRPEEALDLVE